MKNSLMAILLLSASVTHADWQDPESPFDAGKNDAVTKQLSWHISKDIQKTCEQEHVKRGFAKPTWRVDACSFWKGDTCDIFTKPNPTLHDIGHELRHCYQGHYH
jgi:hypothetical protein